MLLYICFITILLPQLSFAAFDEVDYRAYSIETENNYLKIIQGVSYHDGTILLRLVNKEFIIDSSCQMQNLSFTILRNPNTEFTVKQNINYPIAEKINFCSTSITSIQSLFPTSELPCYKSPYGIGCKVTCNGTDIQTPACDFLPKCNEAQQVPGCNGKELDCMKYPTAPECIAKIANTTNEEIDCAKYPGAYRCLLDCSVKPNLPGCNDCTNNENALGCNVCKQTPHSMRCQSGYCDSNPDVPDCSLITMDKVKIHAVDDIKNGNKFILATYYCFEDFNCGKLFDMEGVQIKYVNSIYVYIAIYIYRINYIFNILIQRI